MANIIFPTRWRIRPPQSVALKLGHPLTSGLVSVLMPGRTGWVKVYDLLQPWDIFTARGFPVVTQTVLGEAGSGSGGDYTASSVAPPWLTASRGNIGAWSIACGIKSNNIAQSKYIYFEGSGGLAQVALVSLSGTGYELFANGYTGTNPRTSSQITIADLNMHHIGYTLKGSSSAEYARWLDGQKTVIDSSMSFVAPAGTIRALLGADVTTAEINASLSYLYIWDRYVDLSWVAAEPFAMFGEGMQSRAYGFFGASGLTTLSPSSIGSAEAFGGPVIVPGVRVLSPSGIASAEAFGTPTVDLSINKTILPSGIPSDESVGTPYMRAPIGTGGIVSAAAIGTPRIAQSTASRVLIGGADRTAYIHLDSEFSFNAMKGSRGSCSIPLVVDPGDPFIPLTGEFIEIFDPVGERVWAGTIEEVGAHWLGNAGNHIFVINGVTLDSLFDALEVDKTHFNGVSAGSAFSDLYTASGVTLVTLGDVDSGDTITALEVTRISDGFTSIALRSNKIWFIDPSNLTLNLITATARAAPWIMTEDEILWESAQWRQSRADFRDTEVIQSPDGSTQTIIALTAQSALGRRTARLTLTTSYNNDGAIQEATAALRRFSTLPAQLVVSTDRAGLAMGMLLEIAVTLPVEASGLLNGMWQIVEVEARMLPGMSRVDPTRRRLPADLELGHFRYTVHLVNALSTAIFQGDGSTTVFALPVTPGSVSSIVVSPHPELYTAVWLGGADVSITPAMPAGTHALAQYTGDSTPDANSWLNTWEDLTPIAASAGPTSSSGGATALEFLADATLRDLTVMDDATPHAIVTHAGAGVRALVVLRLLLGADLIVRLNKNGAPLLTLVIDSATAVDAVLEFPLSARQFTVTIASPGVVSVTDATLANDDIVVLHTTGALPTGLLPDVGYYVVNTSGASFQLAATLGGSPIDTSGTQSGNHWLSSTAIVAPAFADLDVLTLDILASDGAIDKNGIASITLEWEA